MNRSAESALAPVLRPTFDGAADTHRRSLPRVGGSGWFALIGAAGYATWSAMQRDFGAEGYWIPYLALALAFGCMLPALAGF